MDPRWLLRIARRWLPWLLATVLLAGGSAYVVSSLQPRTYEAEATLIVGTSLSGSPGYNELLVSEQLSATYASVATTRPVLVRVIDRLRLTETAEQLQQRMSADAVEDSTLLTITASDADPDQAAALVNALVDELIASSPAGENPLTDIPQSVDEQLAAIRTEIEDAEASIEPLINAATRSATQETDLRRLQERLITLRDTYATLIPFSTSNAPNLLTVVQPAIAAQSPASPRPLLNSMLAAMAGFLVVAAIAFSAEYPGAERSS